MFNFENISKNSPPKLSAEETEALLPVVRERLALKTFDVEDLQLIQQMVESLGDSRGMIRLGFADALGDVGKPALPFLLNALANHPNVVVKRAAAKTITLIADTESVPYLIDALLHDADTVVKTSCVGALARMGEAAVPSLLEILASNEHPESTKGQAAWALAFIGPQAKEILYQQIVSDSCEVRTAVVGALARVAQDTMEEEAINLLVQSLSDPEPMVRCEAAAGVANLSYEPARQHLINLLTYSDEETRKAGALALMKQGDRSAVKPLEEALNLETTANVQLTLKLAISQLNKLSES